MSRPIESTAATNFRDQSPDYNSRTTRFEDGPNNRNIWSVLPRDRDPKHGSSSNNDNGTKSNKFVSDNNISEHPSEYEQSLNKIEG